MEIFKDPNILKEYNFEIGTSQRALFHSKKNIDEWLKLSKSESYPGAKSKLDPVTELYVNLLKKIIPEINSNNINFLSLGCGDGRIDLDIIHSLENESVHLKYIPVDISSFLLEYVLTNSPKNIEIPFAIESDFEEGIDFIKNRICKFRQNPTIISMLGNTLSNLDKGIEPFLNNLKSLIFPNDYFFTSVSFGPCDIFRGNTTINKLKGLCAAILTKENKELITSDNIEISISKNHDLLNTTSIIYSSDSNAIYKTVGIDEGFCSYLEKHLNVKLVAEKKLENIDGLAFGIGFYLFKK